MTGTILDAGSIVRHDFRMQVLPIERLELAVVPRSWPFARDHREKIDVHFGELQQRGARLWNGRVLLMHDYTTAGRSLRGKCFVTDFASFLAWRDWGFPDRSVTDCAAMGAIQSVDGAFLLGVMSAHTANAGAIYFPCGAPEPRDIRGDRLDLKASVAREVTEETGIRPDQLTAESTWQVVFAGPRTAFIKILHSQLHAIELRGRILDYLHTETWPEFADIRIVRGPGDFDVWMPEFVTAFMSEFWRQRNGVAPPVGG